MFPPNFNVFRVNGYFINQMSDKPPSAFLSNHVTKASNVLLLNVRGWLPFFTEPQSFHTFSLSLWSSLMSPVKP